MDSPRQRRCARLALLLVLAACSGLAACASGNLRTQALKAKDTDLSGIEDNLCLLVVSIRPAYANLQVRGIILEDPAADRRLVFSFFNNAILGSRAVPFTQADDGIEQVLLLDLPAATYTLKEIDFALQSDDGAYTQVMRNDIDERLEFRIPNGQSSYLGNLDIEVTGVTVHGTFGDREVTFPTDKPVTLYTLTTTTGHLKFAVNDREKTDIASAREQYPALAGTGFQASIISMD